MQPTTSVAGIVLAASQTTVLTVFVTDSSKKSNVIGKIPRVIIFGD